MILAPIGIVGAVFLFAGLWSRLGNPPPGTTRRLVYRVGGVATASLGFFTGSVLVVAGVAALVFLATVATNPQVLRTRRIAGGAELLPIAIVTTFGLVGGDPWLFGGAMLTIGVAHATFQERQVAQRREEAA
jgi:hypothetical protein